MLLQNFQFILDKSPGIRGGRKIVGSLPFTFYLNLPCQQTIQSKHGRSAPESRSTIIYPGRSSPQWHVYVAYLNSGAATQDIWKRLLPSSCKRDWSVDGKRGQGWLTVGECVWEYSDRWRNNTRANRMKTGGEQLRYLWRRARQRSACACGPSPACLWEGAAFVWCVPQSRWGWPKPCSTSTSQGRPVPSPKRRMRRFINGWLCLLLIMKPLYLTPFPRKRLSNISPLCRSSLYLIICMPFSFLASFVFISPACDGLRLAQRPCQRDIQLLPSCHKPAVATMR